MMTTAKSAFSAAVLLLISLPVFVQAQSDYLESLTPRSVAPQNSGEILQPDSTQPANSARDAILVDVLRGLVFSDKPADFVTVSEASGIRTQVAELHDQSDFVARFESYLNEPISLALLDQVNAKVVSYFRELGFLVVDAYAPDGQDITNGVVQIAVVIGKLGDVRVAGAEHFSEDLISPGIRANRGDAIAIEELQEDLDWINQNPFREVNIALQPGASFGETDLVLNIEDRFPMRFYGGAEDTGTSLVGEQRWLAGVNWGNAFGLDHQLNYQYTSSYDGEKLRSHSLSYQMPLAWRDTLRVFAASMKSDPDVTVGGFDLQGENQLLGLRYEMPLSSWQGVQQALVFGADYKRSNNNLQFGSLEVFDTFTDVVQFNLAYNASLNDKYGATQFSVTLNNSPGGINNDNSDAAFESSRLGASADYSYLRTQLNRTTLLRQNYVWTANLQTQQSNKNLLGSEQLGIGGYASVRGYDEYQFVGDTGILLRNELRAPAISLIEDLDLLNGVSDSLQYLAFVDYGRVQNVDPLVGESSQHLFSAGLGLRYSISSYLSLRADYGWQLKSVAANADKDSRLHFSLVLGY